jgi:hypothetical protein
MKNLGFGHLGNGIAVWDRSRTSFGDYLTVAHITPNRTVNYRKGVEVSDEQRKAIEEYAKTEDPQISTTQEIKVFNQRP